MGWHCPEDRNAKLEALRVTRADVYEVLENAAGAVGSRDEVDNLFSSAKSQGLNVIRLFAFGVGTSLTLQTSPGKFSVNSIAHQGCFQGFTLLEG